MSTTVFYNLILNGGSPLRAYAWLRYDGGGRFTLYDSSGNILAHLGATHALNASTTIGDGSTNYAAFAADGEISLLGTARVTKTVLLNPQSLTVQAANPATPVDLGIAGAWQFADAATNSVVGVLPLPLDMDRTVAPSVSLLWSSTTVDPGDDTVRALWQVEYLFLSPNEDTTGAAEGSPSALFSASTVSHGLVVSELAGLALAASTDEILLIRVSRLGGDVTDTLGDTAELSGVKFTYTSDRLGTGL